MFEAFPTTRLVRFWDVCDKHNVNIFYTAPTAIRAIMRQGEAPVRKTSRKSIKLLGTVGEPINPEVWLWYHDVVGEKRCPIVDTWWQTETGGILITPLPGATALKPGSATRPFFGLSPRYLPRTAPSCKGPSRATCLSKTMAGMQPPFTASRTLQMTISPSTRDQFSG